MSTAAPAVEQHATLRVLLISACAALGGFLFGYDTAVINGAVDAIRGEFGLSATATGFAVSCALLGSALGAWYAGPLADRFGRVHTMRVAAAFLAVSALGAGLAFGVWDLILWRIVGGIGVGVASVIAPTYIAEISPAHVRGRLGSMQQLAIVLGIFASLLADAWLANTAGGAAQPLWLGLDAWRWMFLVAVVPAIDLRRARLRRSRIAAPPRREGPPGTGEASAARRARHEERRRARCEGRRHPHSLRLEYVPRLRDLRGPRMGLLPIVWMGILLSVFQQFVGINVIFYYSATLWHSVGFSEADAFSITVATSIVNVLVTLVAIALVDKVGRKPLLLVGSAGMAVTLGAMAVCFANAVTTADGLSLPAPWNMVALVSANLYVVCFGLSWGPMVWVLLGEMFPNRIRAIALAVAASAQWLANFVITATFPGLAEIGLAFAYGLYAAFAVMSYIFVYRAVRETKGMELEAMTG